MHAQQLAEHDEGLTDALARDGKARAEFDKLSDAMREAARQAAEALEVGTRLAREVSDAGAAAVAEHARLAQRLCDVASSLASPEASVSADDFQRLVDESARLSTELELLRGSVPALSGLAEAQRRQQQLLESLTGDVARVSGRVDETAARMEQMAIDLTDSKAREKEVLASIKTLSTRVGEDNPELQQLKAGLRERTKRAKEREAVLGRD